MQESIIKAEHISKTYRLGAIGQTTLKAESQRIMARLRHKEDPTKKIGVETYAEGERFYALRDISFQVMPGEAVGIIGHNGAGKSTMLKLLTRVTVPTEGDIWLNGRVASMLEVGTGFHPELTGKENIYLNGAILGMTRKEIGSKLDEIIEFSECEEFIDTPVKRYSSGMYVKLAFSVAAYLDSEIMLLDEVLAVGDVRFQQKCLRKINETVEQDGRTVLFVSHNMNAVRQLCPRSIVLDHGSIVFDGDTETAILEYLGGGADIFQKDLDLTKTKRLTHCSGTIRFERMHIYNESNCLSAEESLDITFCLQAKQNVNNVRLMLILFYRDGTRIGKTESSDFDVQEGSNEIQVAVPLDHLADGNYYFEINILRRNNYDPYEKFDGIPEALSFQIENPAVFNVQKANWDSRAWGHVMLHPIKIVDEVVCTDL